MFRPYLSILCLPIILATAVLAEGVRGPMPPQPPKPPSERLAPAELTSDAAIAADATWETFDADATRYRLHQPADKIDAKELARLEKNYLALRANVQQTSFDALLTYSWQMVLAHHEMHDAVIKLYTDAITRFAGTAEALRLREHLGTYRLERMNDPKAAAADLRAIPQPPGENHGPLQVDPFVQSRATWQLAQLNLARCEIALGQIDAAVKHFHDLEAAIPKLRAWYTQECRKFDEELLAKSPQTQPK